MPFETRLSNRIDTYITKKQMRDIKYIPSLSPDESDLEEMKKYFISSNIVLQLLCNISDEIREDPSLISKKAQELCLKTLYQCKHKPLDFQDFIANQDKRIQEAATTIMQNKEHYKNNPSDSQFAEAVHTGKLDTDKIKNQIRAQSSKRSMKQNQDLLCY